ncbi:hypothetical protein CAEBREN_25062 [Caenorhabditis brenneri]|uniref:Uncharacterized protein n=1 Tax=Caenorhabditis brenneri TaxID=135651 RepID=G0P742_CAEBE|nr:hypothetical protein CAEBREN_25062 [Caenorhabditis brenneri]
MVGQFPRDHRNTYSEGSPNAQYKSHQLTKGDYDNIQQYISDLKNTDRPCSSIPPEIWHSLPADIKQEIIKARNSRPQRKKDDTSYRKEAGKTRTHSMSHGHNERSSYNGRPPRQPRIFVDSDPNDPLSDDAFTQQYEPDYWARLPKRVRYEIERQRFVKKERAKKAAADQSSTLN